MKNRIISFGRFETASVLTNALLIKTLLGLPQLLCRKIGSAAWISSVVSGVLFLILVGIILKLYERFENRNIIEIAQLLGGTVGKWVCAVLILLPLLFKGAITLRLAADTINLITPYRIPSALTAVLVGLVMIVTAYRGVEGVARMHALMVPVILLALVIVALASVGSYRLTNLFPFWGLGQKTVWRESVTLLSMYTDVIYIFLLYPYVKSQKIFRRACLWGTGIAVFAQSAVIFGYVLVTQYPESAELFMPVYQVSRIINLSGGAQSIEALFYPVWIIASLLYLSLSDNFAVEILGQVSGTKYEKLFIIPVGAVMFLIAYFPPSVMDAMRLSASAAPFLVVCCMLVPVLILLTAFCVKGRRKPVEK